MANVGDVTVRLTAQTTQFTTALNKAQSKLKTVGDSMASIGARLSLAVTLPLVALGRAALKSSISFESAFAGVRKTVKGTEGELKTLSNGIIAMSRTLPATAEEIAGVAEAAGQLGIQTANILEFTKVMIDLGETTNLVAREAAEGMARLANIVELPQSQFSNMGSTIVDLGNNFATTEKEILAMGLRIAGAGKQVGLSTAEILALSTALSSVGIEAQAGGTAISKVMIELSTAVAQGGRRLNDFADVAGMSGKSFRQAFREDAAGSTLAFIEGLRKMKEEGRNVFSVLEELEIHEFRVGDALTRAANAGELFRRSLERGSKAWDENSALTLEANLRYLTTESRLKILRNQISEIAGIFGDQMNPALGKFIVAGTFVTNKLRTMDNATRNLVLGFGLVLGAIPLVMGALGLLIRFVTPLRVLGVAVGLVGTFGLVIASQWEKIAPRLTDAFDKIAEAGKEKLFEFIGPEGEKKIKNFEEKYKNLSTEVGKVWDELVSRDYEALSKRMEAATTAANTHLEAFVDKLDQLFPGSKKLFEALNTKTEEALDTFKKKWDPIYNEVKAGWKEFVAGDWDALKMRLSNLGEGIKNDFQTWVADMDRVVPGLQKMYENIQTFGPPVLKALWEAHRKASREILGALVEIINGDWDGLSQRYERLKDEAKKAVDGMLTEMDRLMPGSKKAVEDMTAKSNEALEGWKKGFKDAFDWVTEKWEEFKKTDWAALGQDISTAVSPAQFALEQFGSMAESIGMIVSDTFKLVGEAIKAMVFELFGTQENTVRTLQFLESFEKSVNKHLKSAADGIRVLAEEWRKFVTEVLETGDPVGAIEKRAMGVLQPVQDVVTEIQKAINRILAGFNLLTRIPQGSIAEVFSGVGQGFVDFQTLMSGFPAGMEAMEESSQKTMRVVQDETDKAAKQIEHIQSAIKELDAFIGKDLKESIEEVRKLGDVDLFGRGAAFPGQKKERGRDNHNEQLIRSATEFEAKLEDITVDIKGVIDLMDIMSTYEGFTKFEFEALPREDQRRIATEFRDLGTAITEMWKQLSSSLTGDNKDMLDEMMGQFLDFGKWLIFGSYWPELIDALKVETSKFQDVVPMTDKILSKLQDNFMDLDTLPDLMAMTVADVRAGVLKLKREVEDTEINPFESIQLAPPTRLFGEISGTEQELGRVWGLIKGLQDLIVETMPAGVGRDTIFGILQAIHEAFGGTFDGETLPEQIRKHIEKLGEATGLFVPEIEGWKAAIEAYKKSVIQIEAKHNVWGDSYDPLKDQIAATETKLIALEAAILEMGGFEEIDIMIAIDKAKEIDKTREELRKLQDQAAIQDAFEGLGSTLTNSLDDMLRGVLQGTQSMSDAFKNMVQNILLSLASNALKNAITGIFSSVGRMAGDALGGSGAGGFLSNILGSGLPGLAGVTGVSAFASLGGGGIAGANAALDAAFTSGLIPFAEGGQMRAGQLGLVGERGPELFQPKTAGTVIPNHMLSQMGANVEVNVINQNGSRIQTRETNDGMRRQIEVMVTDALRQDLASGGKGSQAIASTFGLARQGRAG